jgi:hypothetical protein
VTYYIPDRKPGDDSEDRTMDTFTLLTQFA